MLLERLAIENYGVYEGRSEFDLSSTREKPVVLVGGMNGAGKTTIFECLMIALYGRSYLGRKVTKDEYSQFVVGRMHRHGASQSNSASVEVSFRFYHNGNTDMYEVCRSWDREGASSHETLLVKKNGEAMRDIDETQWQSFLEGLLPLGIARLFFFDGEKIVRMTEWGGPGSDEMRASLDTLMGTELVSRLRSDLELYAVRRTGGNGGDGPLQTEYERIKKEKEFLVSEIDSLKSEADRKKKELDLLSREIGSKESKISGLGGGYADIRGRLLTQKAVLDEKIRHQTKAIHEELSEDAPFCLARQMVEKLKGQIERDTVVMQNRMSASLVERGLDRLREEMSSDGFWPDGVDGPGMSAKVSGILDGVFAMEQEGEVFDLAPGEASRIIDKISGLDECRRSIAAKMAEYAGAREELEKIETDLTRVPSDDEMGPQITQINEMHQELGMLRSEMEHIGQQVSAKESLLRIVKSRLKRLIESIHKNEKSNTGVHLASKMKDVLDTYSASLRERKMRELEANLLDAIRTLLHKKHVERMEIDRDTLEIRVYENGSESPGSLKSMGERQMVGTALLWAIARTSGRSLPFVIDTPLGRLDGRHLSNLTSRFYPVASHQLILLSTDREIGPKEYSQLSQHTSRAYKIECNEEKSVTTVSEGYFTEGELVQA